MRWLRLTVLFLFLVSGLGCGVRERILRYTAIPASNTTDLAERFRPFTAHLAERLGIPVEYVPTEDYSASVEAFVNGDVQLAWFGGLTGVRARAAVPGARAIAQGRVDPRYRAYFVAHPSAGLTPSEEFPKGLAGKRFTFGSRSSTSGRLMPEYFIRRFTGRTPEEFFGAPMSFSGSHEKTAQLVEAGTFEAGVMDYKTYERLVAEKRIDPGKCRVIYRTPPFPDYNFTAHPSLEEQFGRGFTEKLQKVLIEIDRPELLAAVNRPEGLIPATNEEFDALAGLARELGLVR